MAQARHAVHLHPRPELELVPGHRGADRHAGELGDDAELGERRLQHLAALLDEAAVDLVLRAALEHVRGRELPGAGSVPGAEVDRHLSAGLDGCARRWRGVDDLVGRLRLGLELVGGVDGVLVQLVGGVDRCTRLGLLARRRAVLVAAELEQLAQRRGHPARPGRDRVEDASHRDARREQEPEQPDADEDHGRADDAGDRRERRGQGGAEQTAGVAQPVRRIDRRAPTDEVQQPDDSEHHEHDPQADAQRRRCARLVVLVRAFVVEIVGGETVRPVPGEQQHREAEARHREDDPPPAEHGGAAVGEEAPDRPGQVGSEPEHREHADDDERDRERVGAVSAQLASGCLATPLPGGRARRSAPASVATALRSGLPTARARGRSHRASTVTPASPDSAGYPGHWGEGTSRATSGYSAGK